MRIVPALMAAFFACLLCSVDASRAGEKAGGAGPAGAPDRNTAGDNSPGMINILGPSGNLHETNLTYTWRGEADASWYRLWIRRTMPAGGVYNWSNWYEAGVDVFQGADGSVSLYLPGHVPGADYQWWVQGWGRGGYGPWSRPLEFHVEDNSPAKPVLREPRGAWTGAAPVFRWEPAERAEWYRVYARHGETAVLDEWTENTAWTLAAPLPAGNYSWWVGAWNTASRRTVWSDEVVFNLGGAVPKPLLTWHDVESSLAGTFVLPIAEDGNFRFGYASGVHTQLADGTLLVAGHPHYRSQARVRLPGALDGRECERVGGWTDITGGLMPEGWSPDDERYVTGGLLALNDSIYFTLYQWYNGSGTDWQTQGYYQGSFEGGGRAHGLWRVAGELAHHSRVGGYLSAPPRRLLDAGFDYLAGLQGTYGAALGRWGPNLFAVSSSPEAGRLPAAALISHPAEELQAPPVRAHNAGGAWWAANRPANERWWIGNRVTDMKWIETETRRGVLCFVYRGLGHTWYGHYDGGPGHPNPYSDAYGYQAEGWALQAWIYDPEDLIAVFRGEREPWSLAPAEAVLLTERLPGSERETYYSVFTGSARPSLRTSERGGRLIVLQADEHPANEWESTPKGYVFYLP